MASGLSGMALGDAYVNILAETSALQGGLLRAQAMVSSFVGGAGSVLAKGMVGAMVAIPAAIGGAMVYSIKSFVEAEVVTKKLSGAIAMAGGNVETLMPKYEKLADKISRVTKWDDEAVKSAAASALARGLSTKKMEEAILAATGLAARMGIDLGSAMNMVTRAGMGNTMMLQRYFPQLKQATTQTEKWAMVMKIGAAGIGMARGEIDTISGAFGQMRKSIGEVFESIGQGLVGSGAFKEVLQGVTDKIWALKDSVDALVAGGQFQLWIDSLVGGVRFMYARFSATFQTLWLLVKTLFNNISALVNAIGQTIWQPFAMGAQLIYTAWKNLTNWLGETLARLWEMIQNPGKIGKGMLPEWKGLFAGMEEVALERMNMIASSWGLVIENISFKGFTDKLDAITNEYNRRNESTSQSLGIMRKPGYPTGAKGAGTGGGMADKASVSIISLADIWKKMQEDAVKKRAEDKKIDLAQKQLNAQEQATAYLGQIVGKQNIGVGLMRGIYGNADTVGE
ncbi:MAG: hypothetical protein WC359_14270 [Dehalococcoidia bacterium]